MGDRTLPSVALHTMLAFDVTQADEGRREAVFVIHENESRVELRLRCDTTRLNVPERHGRKTSARAHVQRGGTLSDRMSSAGT